MSALAAVGARRLERYALSPWGAFWRSRLLIWGSGVVAVLLLGTSGSDWGFDPTAVSQSFGRVGNVLMAPGVRWDAIWYLQVAHSGYLTTQATAFFPLYPLLIGALGACIGSGAVAGVLVSCASLLVALEVVRRLTELELGEAAAGAAVPLLAFTPMAVFFSAVYTESLFLALSAGMFLAARRSRWPLAGTLGLLAAMTRVTGVLLVIPFVLLLLDQWRARRTTDRPIRILSSLPWALLILLGAVAFGAFLALSGFGWLAPMDAQKVFWAHYFTGPLGGIRDGVAGAAVQLRSALSGVPVTTYQSQQLLQLTVLIAAGAALVAAFRRLPVAYGGYAAASLAVTLSSPTLGDPLRALDRYTAVLFPVFMATGAWAAERGHTRKLVLLSAAGAVFFTVQFVTWRFVA